jgi:hypothetical protein
VDNGTGVPETFQTERGAVDVPPCGYAAFQATYGLSGAMAIVVIGGKTLVYERPVAVLWHHGRPGARAAGPADGQGTSVSGHAPGCRR